MKQFICSFILLCLTFFSSAQLEDVKIDTKEGQRVYVHVIEKGNTLWGLHKLYDVSIEKIVELNPGVQNGLQEGQTVYIPVPIITQEKKHIVVAGETLSAIGRKYNVDVKDLILWNPSAENGLSIGQEIVILDAKYVTGEKVAAENTKPTTVNPTPSEYKVSFNDSIVEHTVAPGETLYSISKRYIVSDATILSFNNLKSNRIKTGDVLKIPLKKERISKVDVREVPLKEQVKNTNHSLFRQKKDEYKVAIVLPFLLNKGAGYSEAISNMATEFLMGAQMAIDSLEKAGLNAKVYVYDTENNTDKVKSILSKPEFSDMDLIIGPMNKDHAQMIADWCLTNEVKMVCPVNVDTKILQNNPLVYTTAASDITLMKGLAKYMATQFTHGKIVLIKPGNAKDSILYQTFRTEYNRIAGNGAPKLIETTPTGFTSYLSASGQIGLVYPTNDNKAVTAFMGELSRFSHKFGSSSYVFGTDEWLKMDGLNAFYRNKYRVTVPTTLDLNYTYERTKYQVRKYRTIYRSDLSKVAIQGFDVMYNFCSELLLNKPVGQLIMNNFKTIQIGPNHGFENQNVEILSHSDYEIINITNGIR